MGGRPHWAALEAQERKPKEYIIAVTDTGQIYGQWTDIPYGSTFERITVIEKLPVKVTREMLSNFNAILNEGVGGAVRWTHGYKSLVRAIKSLGIDAIQEPSNE